MLSGFFWTAEALSDTPPEGMGYWQNIKNKLQIKFQQSYQDIPGMKWAFAAGVLTMIGAAFSLASFIIGAGPMSWLSFTVIGFSLGSGLTWYNASKWNSTSDNLNKFAAGGKISAVLIGITVMFAPGVAILGSIASIATYVSTALWFLSYPIKAGLEKVETKPVVKNTTDTHTPPPVAPLVVPYYRGKPKTTLTAADFDPNNIYNNGWPSPK